MTTCRSISGILEGDSCSPHVSISGTHQPRTMILCIVSNNVPYKIIKFGFDRSSNIGDSNGLVVSLPLNYAGPLKRTASKHCRATRAVDLNGSTTFGIFRLTHYRQIPLGMYRQETIAECHAHFSDGHFRMLCVPLSQENRTKANRQNASDNRYS
jgi:hypothetical protein